jgi:hypothetical protein
MFRQFAIVLRPFHAHNSGIGSRMLPDEDSEFCGESRKAFEFAAGKRQKGFLPGPDSCRINLLSTVLLIYEQARCYLELLHLLEGQRLDGLKWWVCSELLGEVTEQLVVCHQLAYRFFLLIMLVCRRLLCNLGLG